MPGSKQEPRLAVLNLVGLCSRLLGKNTPNLHQFIESTSGQAQVIEPVCPAVTCSAQATYLTGTQPTKHGVVGNGWYDRTLHEHHFWKQSNRLVGGEKVWETIRKDRPDFRCANLFWWFNMYSSADFSITPRPLYRSDGLKTFDVHSHPLSIRDEIKKDLGEFPFPSFWGPRAGLPSSEWITNSAKWIEEKESPGLSLVYLPHLDYDLQRYGPDSPEAEKAVSELDALVGDLLLFYQKRNVRVMMLSEYGITPAKKVVYPNRALRKLGHLNIKEELRLEYLDCGGSDAFALTDHQVAHIYINRNEDPFIHQLCKDLENLEGIAQVITRKDRGYHGLDHDRAGDLILVAEEDSWFAYYHWLDDSLAPDFARCVDVHRKYGYDPAELFVDPSIPFPFLKASGKILAKKLGFRIFMDLVPLNPQLVRGTHGGKPTDPLDWPIIFGDSIYPSDQPIQATEVHGRILQALALPK
jgi:predicted AlkP superfamily pyrophosphatase or phosphodiesterase